MLFSFADIFLAICVLLLTCLGLVWSCGLVFLFSLQVLSSLFDFSCFILFDSASVPSLRGSVEESQPASKHCGLVSLSIYLSLTHSPFLPHSVSLPLSSSLSLSLSLSLFLSFFLCAPIHLSVWGHLTLSVNLSPSLFSCLSPYVLSLWFPYTIFTPSFKYSHFNTDMIRILGCHFIQDQVCAFLSWWSCFFCSVSSWRPMLTKPSTSLVLNRSVAFVWICQRGMNFTSVYYHRAYKNVLLNIPFWSCNVVMFQHKLYPRDSSNGSLSVYFCLSQCVEVLVGHFVSTCRWISSVRFGLTSSPMVWCMPFPLETGPSNVSRWTELESLRWTLIIFYL